MSTKGDKAVRHIGDLTPDPNNVRRHSARNVGTIVQSLHRVGAARSIVIDEGDVVLCGNATVDAAAEAGIERVMVVEADGNTLVAVRRTGLTPQQKAELAISDNRASDLSEFDYALLGSQAVALDIQPADIGFEEHELARLVEEAAAGLVDAARAVEPAPEPPKQRKPRPACCPECGHKFEV